MVTLVSLDSRSIGSVGLLSGARFIDCAQNIDIRKEPGNSTMSEQELKLNVPRECRASVERAMRRGAVRQVQLRAKYFDTPDRALMKAGIALRLRQEGRRWVQTIKMAGAHALEREEFNHPLTGPTLDLSVYAELPVYKKLAKVQDVLEVRYETNIRRMYRNIRTPAGVVEVSYDLGKIIAGDISLPVSEIEFEKVTGQLQAVFLLGLKWQAAHGLLLDMRSKSERGDRLAELARKLAALGDLDDAAASAERAKAVASYWAPWPIQPVRLKPSISCAQALGIVMQECLEQIARNSAILAEVDTAGICRAATPEHTHQLRVGMRRIRSAWSLFEPLASLPPQTWRDELKDHFAGLGTARDDDVLRQTVLPVLSAAGQPPVEIKSHTTADTAPNVVRSKAFQTWLIELLAWAVGSHPIQSPAVGSIEAEHAHVRPMRNALRERLQKWHKRVLQDGLRFDTLEIEAKHDLRKRAKRLRYGLQFAESILPSRKLQRYRKQLSRIQDILGEMNDLYVAREKFEHIRDTQPGAWFAVGWIASRLDVLTKQAKEAFEVLKTTDHF